MIVHQRRGNGQIVLPISSVAPIFISEEQRQQSPKRSKYNQNNVVCFELVQFCRILWHELENAVPPFIWNLPILSHLVLDEAAHEETNLYSQNEV